MGVSLRGVADPGGPALSGGTSWLIAYGGAKHGGKGELTLRASTIGGFQFVVVCFWSIEEIVG